MNSHYFTEDGKFYQWLILPDLDSGEDDAEEGLSEEISEAQYFKGLLDEKDEEIKRINAVHQEWWDDLQEIWKNPSKAQWIKDKYDARAQHTLAIYNMMMFGNLTGEPGTDTEGLNNYIKKTGE